jgi:hypothetical protein
MEAVGSGALRTYMQDHLAGSSGGTSLIRRLEKGSESEADRRELEALRKEIEADRETLLELMAKAGSEPSRIKNFGAVAGDALARPKLRSSSPDGRILKLEAIIIGVTGKRQLWLSLLALIDAGETTFAREEVERLRDRADDQLERLRAIHARTAANVLSG